MRGVPDEPRVVRGAHALAALGDKADERDVARAERLLVGVQRISVVGKLGGRFNSSPPCAHEFAHALVETIEQTEGRRARLEECTLMCRAEQGRRHTMNTQGSVCGVVSGDSGGLR